MKNWSCVFEAQKGHPRYKDADFPRRITVVVACPFKGGARPLAEAELPHWDPNHWQKYRNPVVEPATDLDYQQYQHRRAALTSQPDKPQNAPSLSSGSINGAAAAIRVYEYPICAPWAIRIGTVTSSHDGTYGYTCLVTNRSVHEPDTDLGNIKQVGSLRFQSEAETIKAGLQQAAHLMERAEDVLEPNHAACLRMALGYATLPDADLLQRYVTTLLPQAQEDTMDAKVLSQTTPTVQQDDGSGVSGPAANPDHLSRGGPIDHALTLDALNAQLNALEIGQLLVLDGLSNALYHAAIGYSSTNLKEELISSQYRHALETGEIEREQKRHFVFGSVFHSLLLQPHLVAQEYAFEPDLPSEAFTSADSMKAALRQFNDTQNEKLPLSGTKAELAERIRHHINPDSVFQHELTELWQAEQAQGLLPVSLEDQRRAQRMVQSAMNNPAVRNWYTIHNQHTACERSYFTKTVVNVFGEPIELILKARLDKEIGSFVIDTKTIELRLDVKQADAMTAINREIESRGYHISAAHYLALSGKKKFFWIFHNKTLGYEWEIIVEASDDHLQLGHFERHKALQSMARAIAKKTYPAPIVQPVDVNNVPTPLLSELTYSGSKQLEQHIADNAHRSDADADDIEPDITHRIHPIEEHDHE